jgi:hypothetical protein
LIAIIFKLIVFTIFTVFSIITITTASLVNLELSLIVFVNVALIAIINIINIININMSSLVPGNVSTFNEEMAPLLEKAKRAYKPYDFKTAFKELMQLLHNDELDECIEAGEELLKQSIPDTTRTRVHIVIASCLEDADDMEKHYKKALKLWTLINAEYPVGKNTRVDRWSQEVRVSLDMLSEDIEEERNPQPDESDDDSDDTDSASTPKLSMSAIATVQIPSATSSDRSSSASDDDSETSGATRSSATYSTATGSTDTLPTRSISSNAGSVHSSGFSRLLGAITPMRLGDHIGMSPAAILRLAWDSKRTVRGRSFGQPSKKLPSSPS